MDQKEIEKRYNELVRKIEEMRMYDGRGTVDAYVCKNCNHVMYTTYKDKGVTPFTTRCRHCGTGTMVHKETYAKNAIPSYIHVKNWYRPTLEQTIAFSKKSPALVEHILNGGLILEDEA